MTYPIEKDIPVPPRGNRQPTPEKYPFSRLSAGESFFVKAPADKDEAENLQKLLTAMAAKRLGRGNFATRRMDGGIRVWRVA